MNDYIWLAQRGKVCTSYLKEGESNKFHVKYVFWKVFKNSIKLLASPFIVMLQTFFSRRAPKGKLGTQRALKWYLGTWALEYLKALGKSRLLGPWALRHSKGTLFSRITFFVCVEDNFLHFFKMFWVVCYLLQSWR